MSDQNFRLTPAIIKQMQAAQERVEQGYVPHQRKAPAQAPKKEPSFQEFNATELHCPNCKRSMPVRAKLLLSLPSGDAYDYLCTGCGATVGEKR